MNATMTKWLSTGSVATLLTIGVASMLPIQAALAGSMDMAKPATPAENESWAVKFEKEAADLNAKATEHAAEAARYRAMPGGASKQAAAYASMAGHCEISVESYRKAAKEALAMAALHRELAKAE